MSPRRAASMWALLSLAAVCALLAMLPVAVGPPAIPHSAASIPALIDQLAEVSHVDYGYSPTVSGGDYFPPLDREGSPGVMLLVPQPHSRSVAMRELGRRGAAA